LKNWSKARVSPRSSRDTSSWSGLPIGSLVCRPRGNPSRVFGGAKEMAANAAPTS
jgi:hypothetical protein